MDIIASAGLCLTVCIIAQLLKENGEIRIALVLLSVSLLFIRLTGSITQIRQLISDLIDKTGLEEIYIKVIFKELGICYITQITSDCCRDSGQSALATQAQIAGKLSMLAIAVPLFKAVIEMIETLIVR